MTSHLSLSTESESELCVTDRNRRFRAAYAMPLSLEALCASNWKCDWEIEIIAVSLKYFSQVPSQSWRKALLDQTSIAMTHGRGSLELYSQKILSTEC